MAEAGSLRLPRTATLATGLTAASHGWAAITGLSDDYWIPAWQWALSAAAATALMAVVACRPDYFRLRDFRLAGVAIIALDALVLIPIPGIVRLYDERIPLGMVPSIAAAQLVLAGVFALAPPVPDQLGREDRNGTVNEANPAMIILVGGVVLLPVWLRSLGSVPILALVRGEAAGLDIAILRFQALSGLGSVPLRLAVGALRNVYLTFAVAWLIVNWRLTRHGPLRRSRLAMALAAVAVAGLFALVTTERAKLGQVLVVLVIAWLLTAGRYLSGRTLVGLGALGLAFPFVFGLLNALTVGRSPFSTAYESLQRRLFFVPGDVMTQYFLLFPARRPFVGGGSIPKISRLFGAETVDIPGFVARVAYPVADDRLQGHANASFIGYGWANFGIGGVVAWTLVTALALVALELVLRRLPRRTAIALRAVAVIHASLLSSEDVTRTVLSFGPGYLDLVVIALIVAALDRRRLREPSAGGISGSAPRTVPV